MKKESARGTDIEKNKLIAAILTNALFTAKLVHLHKGTNIDSKGIFEDVFATWTGISQHFHNETTAQRKEKRKKRNSDKEG